MAGVRTATGHTITVWVMQGTAVRISALLVGEIRGVRSIEPGEISEPFSTPGLAIASRYSPEQLRSMIAQCRRRHVDLGRRFRTLSDIQKALEETRRRGYAVGYNMKSDGWGILAWPILLTAKPLRLGAFALGAHVATLRREEPRLVPFVQRLLANYAAEQKIGTTAATVRSP
jgi:DNA-binding IclR family transcriptional regulator